jgi:hypothetical protein
MEFLDIKLEAPLPKEFQEMVAGVFGINIFKR